MEWVRWLERHPDRTTERELLSHILSAQKLWRLRLDGISLTQMDPVPATSESVEELRATWVAALADRDDIPEIAYRRMNGDAYVLGLDEIARHVVNHGTYHRGEIRGLCRASGCEDFPETDMSSYFALRRG